jgi:hypothetical protein
LLEKRRYAAIVVTFAYDYAHRRLHAISQSEERLPMKFSALVEHVTKKPLPAHVTHFVVEVMASDEEGEDVEVSIHYCFSQHVSIPGACPGPIHRSPQVIVKRKDNAKQVGRIVM